MREKLKLILPLAKRLLAWTVRRDYLQPTTFWLIAFLTLETLGVASVGVFMLGVFLPTIWRILKEWEVLQALHKSLVNQLGRSPTEVDLHGSSSTEVDLLKSFRDLNPKAKEEKVNGDSKPDSTSSS